MTTRHGARSSRAPKNTDQRADLLADIVLDTDLPDDLVDALPDGLGAYGALPELLADTPIDPALILADAVSAADLDTIASNVLIAANQTAETTSASLPHSAIRYDIGKHAARVMARQNLGVAATATMIGITLDRMSAVYNVPIPRAWRDLQSVNHALKCWLPGTIASASLPKIWDAAKKRPFYGLPDYVVSRVRLAQRGYDHGGMVCDYWSRIHPGKINLALVERFDQLTTRDDQRAFLRELLGNA